MIQINRKTAIISGIAVFVLVVALAIAAVMGFNQSKKRQANPSISKQPASQSKYKPGAYPADAQTLINTSKSKPAGAPESYILLVNEQMTLAYNQPANTFIVNANGETNLDDAKRDSQAYLKSLGITDLSKINIIYRARGQW